MPGMDIYVRRISNLPRDAPEWEGASTDRTLDIPAER